MLLPKDAKNAKDVGGFVGSLWSSKRHAGPQRRTQTQPATAVHGVPKAPGRITVQGDNHSGTNTTVACAWAVGAYIRRVLS